MSGLSIITNQSTGRDFGLDVNMRQVENFEPFVISGINPDIDVTDGTVTLWDKKGLLSTLTTETELFASSSSASDTVTTVIISGLDGSYNKKTTSTTTTGQTQVSVGSFLRVRSVLVKSATAVGDIYIAEADTTTAGVPDNDGKVKSKVIAGKQITHNGFFTVPAGKFAVIDSIWGTVDGTNKAAKVEVWIRNQGGEFTNPLSFSINSSITKADIPSMAVTNTEAGELDSLIREKTDFELRASVDTSNSEVFFAVNMKLVDNAELGPF
jgi:hypothetical protein